MAVREWLNMTETASQLHRSPRTLEKWIRDGKLKWRMERLNDQDAKMQRVFHAGEVERLAREQEMALKNAQELERAKAEQRTAVAPIRIESTTAVAVAIVADLVKVFKEELATFRAEGEAHRAEPSILEKLWLRPDEASTYSGLSKVALLSAIREGKLTAIKSGGWRIRRASLEAFEG